MDNFATYIGEAHVSTTEGLGQSLVVQAHAAGEGQQRFKFELSYLVSYTWSKTMEAASFLNPQDSQVSRELTAFDTPHRLIAGGLYFLPVGPGRKWLNGGIASHIIGGWDFNWVGTFQSGTPIALPDYYIYGDPKLSSGQDLNHWFNTSPGIWVARPPDTLRTAKLNSPDIRRFTAPKLDVTLVRNFRIAERHNLQFRAAAFNATNTPLFDVPNTTPTSPLFGVVSITQRNLPRSIELGFRYAF
jgi:hypothetical protein